ncbi:MAG: thioredoxin-dependent thiol peroxidase [Acidobacteria bacterium]|nr:MAG: thioredoxin-dependent thiol peroxidase [Acidobacteriota bacterium]
MTIEVGHKAPEFVLQDQDETAVSLSQFSGSWVVLYFYPKDDTPGCTIEACEFTEGIESFRDLDAVVLGCSPDSPERHQKFINKYDLKVRLLSDPDHGVMEAYGAWGEKVLYGRKSIGVKRSTVIIDPDGNIAHHWKSVRTKGHAAKVRERLEGLRK